MKYLLNNLQQHVSALKSYLQAKYEGVYTIQCHKTDDILLRKVLNHKRRTLLK